MTIVGRLTRHGRLWTLHLPIRWPCHGDYAAALARIRAPRRLTTGASTLTNVSRPLACPARAAAR